MPKKYSGKLNGNYDSSMTFNIAVSEVMYRVRRTAGRLKKSRKADESACGAIHALAKICRGERCTGLLDYRLYESEVEEWRESFFSWFKRVRRHFGEEEQEVFLAGAEEDFQTLLEVAKKGPKERWEEESLRTYMKIPFKTEEEWKLANKAADEKYPVELGSALANYLDRCIEELTTRVSSAEVDQKKASPGRHTDSTSPRLVRHENGLMALCLDNFDAFDNEEDVEQDILVGGYDVEAAIRACLKTEDSGCLDQLDFDSESSMFCVRSDNLGALQRVTEVIYRFFVDKTLRKQYLKK